MTPVSPGRQVQSTLPLGSIWTLWSGPSQAYWICWNTSSFSGIDAPLASTSSVSRSPFATGVGGRLPRTTSAPAMPLAT